MWFNEHETDRKQTGCLGANNKKVWNLDTCPLHPFLCSRPHLFATCYLPPLSMGVQLQPERLILQHKIPVGFG